VAKAAADTFKHKRPSATGKLPAGWSTHTSKSDSARTYFFHKATGRSVWSIEHVLAANISPALNPAQQRIRKSNAVSSKREKPAKISSSSIKSQKPKNTDRNTGQIKAAEVPPDVNKSRKKSKRKEEEKERKTIAIKKTQKLRKNIQDGSSKMKPASDLISEIISKSTTMAVPPSSKSKSKSTRSSLPGSSTLNPAPSSSSQVNRRSSLQPTKSSSSLPGTVISRGANQVRLPRIPKLSKEDSNTSFLEGHLTEREIDAVEIRPSTPMDMDWLDAGEQGEDCTNEQNITRNKDGLDERVNINVIDTNVFIEQLHHVKALLRAGFIAVARAVIQELDGLKGSTREDVNCRSRDAIRWIQQQAQPRNPRVLFQKMADDIRIASIAENNDDRILLYALDLQDVGVEITLVTNDRNLSTKASIEEVAVCSGEALNSQPKNSAKPVPSDNSGLLDPPPDNLTSSLLSVPENVTICCDVNHSEEFTETLKKISHEFLEDLLIAEMEASYQQDWKTIIKIKPNGSRPYWRQRDLATCFKKHHIAVFSMNLPSQFPRVLHNLEESLRTGVNELQLENQLASLCGLVLQKSADTSKNAANRCLNEINSLKPPSFSNVQNAIEGEENLNEVVMDETVLHSCPSSRSSSSPDLSSVLSPVLTSLTHVWHIILVFIQGLYDVLGLPVTEEGRVAPVIQLQPTAAGQLAPKLLSYVDQLGLTLLAGLGPGEVNAGALNAVVDLLNNFKSEFGVRSDEYWQDTPQINNDQMYEFLRVDRDKVENGIQQLQNFRDRLNGCIERLAQL